MMVTLRRLLFLWLFAFWQGGFLFYAAVVVSVGTEVLGTAEDQGWITQQVTNWLNLAGAAALAAWAWDIVAEPASAAWRRRRWSLWSLLVAGLLALILLHPFLDAHMDYESRRLFGRANFRLLHKAYLWISTAQWLGSIGLSWWTLRVWKSFDSQNHETQNHKDRAA